jgi:hypothetical protein
LLEVTRTATGMDEAYIERLHLFDAETGVAIQIHERRAADLAAPSEAHTG